MRAIRSTFCAGKSSLNSTPLTLGLLLSHHSIAVFYPHSHCHCHSLFSCRSFEIDRSNSDDVSRTDSGGSFLAEKNQNESLQLLASTDGRSFTGTTITTLLFPKWRGINLGLNQQRMYSTVANTCSAPIHNTAAQMEASATAVETKPSSTAASTTTRGADSSRPSGSSSTSLPTASHPQEKGTVNSSQQHEKKRVLPHEKKREQLKERKQKEAQRIKKEVQKDWECAFCQHNNFHFRFHCERCGKDKPGGITGFSWHCRYCSASNSQYTGACHKCGAPRLKDGAKRGDWICFCGSHNYSMRLTCRFCQRRRSEGYRYSLDAAKGDWLCSLCKHQNNKHRDDCYACGSTTMEKLQPTRMPPKKEIACHQCGVQNFDFRKICRECGMVLKPEKEDMEQLKEIAGVGLPIELENALELQDSVKAKKLTPLREWVCRKCNYINFGKNRECRRCRFRPTRKFRPTKPKNEVRDVSIPEVSEK